VETSFSRQLERLAAYFESAGVNAASVGNEPEGVYARGRPSAAILLGYPDQFSWLLGEAGTGAGLARLHPVFLWAQLSRPLGLNSVSGKPACGAMIPGAATDPSTARTAPSVLERVVPVPLTAATARFLEASGLREIRDPVPHCVDTSIFRSRSKREREAVRRETGVSGSYVVGTVAAFTKRKKLDKIMDAFSIVSRERSDARLVIKTDRVRSLEGDDLARMAAERKIEDRTSIITGSAGEDEMARLYSLMDVYINLSEWEGFCIPVIEAMASGVPVIAQPGQGPGEIVPYRELFVEGSEQVVEGGTLLSYARPEKAAARLMEAAERPAIMEALAQRGREEAETRYDLRVVGEQWLSLIEKTAGPEEIGR
jgi:glycosyltransferase involved in cell wall biosynthesis